MAVTEAFEAQRPRLFALAYRLLGSASEAEDAVRDAYLRWNAADRALIAAPAAWLATVLTHLCLNRLTSARAQRERYVGEWLPEPVRTDGPDPGPLEAAERDESVSMAFLVLLERLTPPNGRCSCSVRRSATGTAKSPTSSASPKPPPSSCTAGPAGA